MTLTTIRPVLAALAAIAAIGSAAACASTDSPEQPITSSAVSSTTQTTVGRPSTSDPDAPLPDETSTKAPATPDAYTACMTDHGIPAPPGGFGAPPEGAGPPPEGAGPRHEGAGPPPPPGVDEDAWGEAQQACASLAPAPPR